MNYKKKQSLGGVLKKDVLKNFTKITENVKKPKKLMKMINIEQENLNIF